MKTILLLFFISTISSFAQEKGIYLVNKKSGDSIFISESLRIKVVTDEGKKIVGVFKVVDENSISIKENIIPIYNIAKIRRASTFHAIADVIELVVGGTLLYIGVNILLTGGYFAGLGWIGVAPGLPMFVVPFIKNNHDCKKWSYHIKN